MNFPITVQLTDTLYVTLFGINSGKLDMKIDNIGDEQYTMEEVYSILKDRFVLPQDFAMHTVGWVCDFCQEEHNFDAYRYNCMKCVHTDVCTTCWSEENIDGLCPHIDTRTENYQYTCMPPK
jgi:hypothetical protein